MEITMLKTQPVSNDGLSVFLAQKGNTYRVTSELGKMLIDAKAAVPVGVEIPQETQTKAADEGTRKIWPRRYGRGRRR